MVVLSMGGNLKTAFALPAIYCNQYAPPSDSVNGCVTEYQITIYPYINEINTSGGTVHDGAATHVIDTMRLNP